MEKRYQVFISSTFEDLQNARQEVSQALLRADCFPAGMELFPAADEEQFEFIKTIIDQSDYYIIISAGRYGSIHPETGLSYTEMEYDYAVSIGKPIIRLLHKDPFNELKGELIEDTDSGKIALSAFREKMSKNRLVAFWRTPPQLQLEVTHALRVIQRTSPAKGWIRGLVQANSAYNSPEPAGSPTYHEIMEAKNRLNDFGDFGVIAVHAIELEGMESAEELEGIGAFSGESLVFDEFLEIILSQGYGKGAETVSEALECYQEETDWYWTYEDFIFAAYYDIKLWKSLFDLPEKKDQAKRAIQLLTIDEERSIENPYELEELLRRTITAKEFENSVVFFRHYEDIIPDQSSKMRAIFYLEDLGLVTVSVPTETFKDFSYELTSLGERVARNLLFSPN